MRMILRNTRSLLVIFFSIVIGFFGIACSYDSPVEVEPFEIPREGHVVVIANAIAHQVSKELDEQYGEGIFIVQGAHIAKGGRNLLFVNPQGRPVAIEVACGTHDPRSSPLVTERTLHYAIFVTRASISFPDGDYVPVPEDREAAAMAAARLLQLTAEYLIGDPREFRCIEIDIMYPDALLQGVTVVYDEFLWRASSLKDCKLDGDTIPQNCIAARSEELDSTPDEELGITPDEELGITLDEELKDLVAWRHFVGLRMSELGAYLVILIK